MVVCVDSQSLIISEQEKKETYVTMAAGSYYPPAAPTYLFPRCTTSLNSLIQAPALDLERLWLVMVVVMMETDDADGEERRRRRRLLPRDDDNGYHEHDHHDYYYHSHYYSS